MLVHCNPVTSVLTISIPEGKKAVSLTSNKSNSVTPLSLVPPLVSVSNFPSQNPSQFPHFSAPLPNRPLPQNRNGVRLPQPTHRSSSRRRRKRSSPPLPRPSAVAAARSRYYSTFAIASMFLYRCGMPFFSPQKRGILGVLGWVPKLAQPITWGYWSVHCQKLAH
jgi:hypothetical protein